ncbi:hypothetical protein FQR65_LT05675 [Abscondita terminalis]|nr:hypothetical protein FQR65_LT05675 [Abscondita terminalis]
MCVSALVILTTTFVTSILLVVFLILIAYKVTFNYWQKQNVYTWKPTIPYGNAKDVIFQKIMYGSDINDFYNELKIKSMRYGGYYLFFTPVFVPADLELIKNIFVRDFEYFSDRVFYENQKYDPLSGNLLHLSGDRWKMVRAIVTRFITKKCLKESHPLMKQCSNALINLIQETMDREKSVDIKDVLDRFHIDLIGAYFFRMDCNTMNNTNATFKNKMLNFFNSSFKDSLLRLIISVPKVIEFFKVKSYSSEVTTFFIQLVDSILESKQQEKSKNVLNALATNKTALTKSEIVGNTALLFLAGYDSTSNTSTFFFYELALNKKLQDAVRNEIKAVFKKHGGEFRDVALEELQLLEKCIKETLRKYPVSIITTRICIKDYQVPNSDLVIRKGTHVYMPIRGIHYDPEFYPNPEVFDPERFADESVNRRACTWIPFGNGPRHCIGSKFANASMKLSLSMLIMNYEFSLHPSTKNPIRYDPKAFLLQPEKPLRLIAIKINKHLQ